MATIAEAERLKRWRLVLGKEAEQGMRGMGGGEGQGQGDDLDIALSASEQGMDGVLDALYGEERSAGLGGSSPRVARWLGDIRTSLPQSAVKAVTQDAPCRHHPHTK